MAMYFVQHGLSLQKEDDPNRPLSSEGQKEVDRIAGHLQKIGVSVEKVCHSGKTRAKESAQIFADYIGDGKVYELSGMNPNDDVKVFITALKEDNTMYVGHHLPHMDKLVACLTTGDEATSVVSFTNGGVVCVG